ncbi:glycoside hydrolase family 32 protein [Gracilibacillus oryzae]|uniref:Glycoside hydrolase family 32 protein n=1 Tax=Gracilibacillus oryzae TaxID=1672701 RepID=A0A7C8GQS8_9BACI|nr:glycoside hydrolase family 32 protein [Gracilibacillus oryzae]KAB8125929.1 glycoside hydrolase family 32 protein [Gracilibacillus oryzae]
MSLKQTEMFRPWLHFAPKKNWMNDPNGLVYFNGEYHLFFQYNPNDSKWGPMHWGHAISKDLITWDELPIALYPDEYGTIFSGSCVVDWNNTTGFFPDEPGLVAIFTHHLETELNKTPIQSQSLAYSYDNGRTWKKYQSNPVLEHDTKVDFRDPKVFWHQVSNKWIMVLATGQTISIYSSPNLIEWSYESEFGENIGSHEGVWECPDLFELQIEESEESRWVLLVSIGDNPHLDSGSRTQYFVGTFDGTQFKAKHNEVRWLDYGKDNYAGVSFSDIPEEDGRRIYLGWMSNWRYANDVPTHGWRSQMTLPRVLGLRKVQDSYTLVQTPVQELEKYFTNEKILENKLIQKEFRFDLDESYGMITLNIEDISAERISLNIHHSQTNVTSITIDVEKLILTLDRSKSGITSFSDNFLKQQNVKIPNTEKIKLNIIIDSASIEVFGNEGEFALTSLIYPDKACEEISLQVLDGEMVVNGCISKPSDYSN